MNAFEEKLWERREGEKVGKTRGKALKQQKITRKMLEMKLDLETIAKATGLPRKKLQSLE